MSLKISSKIEFLKLKLHEHLSSEQILKFQEKKLRDIILYAYNNVPYYKELFDKIKLVPADIATIEDLKKIPVLTKDAIRKNYQDIISSAYKAKDKKLIYVSTTGSSGIPLKIALSAQEMTYSYLLLHYGYFKSGVRLFAKIAHLKALSGPKIEKSRNPLSLLKEYEVDLKNGPSKNIQELNTIKPDYIYGYPSYLSLAAKFILANNSKLVFKPRGIFTNGEILTDSAKSLISKAFGCPVKDTYGSAEFFRIAFECKCGNLHIIPDSVIMETQDNASEAIITSLYHRAMPLIRYKIGDCLSISNEKCGCNLNFTIIKNIIGRSDDFLLLPSGRIISARAINLLDDVPGVIEYQIIQQQKDYFEVLVKPDVLFSDKSTQQIKDIIQSGCMGESIQINIITTDNIKRSQTGKLRAVISEVKHS